MSYTVTASPAGGGPDVVVEAVAHHYEGDTISESVMVVTDTEDNEHRFGLADYWIQITGLAKQD